MPLCNIIQTGRLYAFAVWKLASATASIAPPHYAPLQEHVTQKLLKATWPRSAHWARCLAPFRCRLHINRFGVIPKGHITGKWRLITDLSFPPSFSVNDGIDPELSYLVYSSVEGWQSPPPIPLVLSLPRMT